MSGNQSANPKLVRRSTKGSVISTTYEFPMERHKNTKTFGELIYDSKSGKYLGRTPKNWAEIIAFYVVFYIALAALFAICMKALLSTIDAEHPKWQLDESLIGVEPGLAFRPFMPDEPHELVPQIKFATNNQESILKWTKNLDEFLEEYKKTNSNQKPCNYGSNHTVCLMDIKKLGGCSAAENAYGYNNSSPCIFLKLNKIYGWTPECYKDDLPDEMPKDLKDYIGTLPESSRDQIWVSCNGSRTVENNRTIDAGPIVYSPRGFPKYFYPFYNNKGYVSPIVSIKLTRPPVNVAFEVECRYWAKNIEYRDSYKDRKASTVFSVWIEKPAR